MMAAFVVLLYLAATASIQTTSAQSVGPYLEHPLKQDLMPTDDAYFAWKCFNCKGPITIAIHGKDFHGTTTADWSDSSTTLPPSFLPAIRPHETAAFSFALYSTTKIDRNTLSLGDFGFEFSLFAPTPTTETFTLTETFTPTSEHTTSHTVETSQIPTPGAAEEEDDSADSDEQETGGLSTGGKAGIGVGVTVGALLLAAGAFLVFRRRKRAETTTIREIPATSAVNLPGPGPGLASNQANTVAPGQRYEIGG
ncbi:uncharacterized protein APUU_60052A [Aspergillus puulaauensis]|uniref:Uncharacterized protein n=1 Tax=Aspergillus puulaauensis TaxID=1220207 RepID=A0A7R7XT31_9EURO|nr:uncharacterized protein APUU_60052A [Aspergillus puulaauensis]BCS27004.1 hypothetical protein APUU_60052A [Aspergillus puulaauensis]